MYGFVKIGAAIPKLHVADCIFNQQEILSLIHQAQEKNIKVLSFPELALTRDDGSRSEKYALAGRITNTDRGYGDCRNTASASRSGSQQRDKGTFVWKGMKNQKLPKNRKKNMVFPLKQYFYDIINKCIKSNTQRGKIQ